MIGRVSDETFLKLFALNVAMQYNRIFGVGSMQAFELYYLHPEDLLRVGIARPHVVMEGAPYSFSRFVYSISGQGGIYAAAVYLLLIYLGSFLKPLMTIVIFIVVFASLFVWKLILRRQEQSLQGYVMLTAAVTGLNIAYALALKLTMQFPVFGFSPFVCMLLGALVQLLFLALYFSFTAFVVKNWKDLGALRFKEVFSDAAQKVKLEGLAEVINRTRPDANQEQRDSGWDAYQRYRDTDSQRERATGGRIERDDPFGRRQ
jgi:hypothetical protein